MPAYNQVISNDIHSIKINGLSAVFSITEVVLETYQKQLVHKRVKDLTIENNFSGTRKEEDLENFVQGK
ncbi:MAG: hypothetical protein ACP8RL_07100 [cyanobacterium endosymbiont of Rhopalodia inflata]